MHVKRHTNVLGATRDEYVQEKLDEWRFKRDYLREDAHDLNFWKMLRALALCGQQAKLIVDSEGNDQIKSM